MSVCAVWLLVALLASMSLAESSEIADLYSSLESADITVKGDVADLALRMDLILEGKTIQTRNMTLDGPGTWIVEWSPFDAEKNDYTVCAALLKNGSVLSRKCYNFFYGGVEPIRFDVRDFRADSRGMHLSISSNDPTIVDIYYMLISGKKAVYVTREEAIPITGSFASPVQKDYVWKQILEDGKEYAGRVKIIELNHDQTRAFMNSFQAREDAIITETYQDEIGASATIMGNSRVPFEGRLRFILSQNGTVQNITEKKTPVLLTDDDETVEISWNGTLEPGIYQLRTILLGRGGDVLDVEENIIEAEPAVRPINATQTKESPSPAGIVAGAMLLLAALLRRRPGRGHGCKRCQRNV